MKEGISSGCPTRRHRVGKAVFLPRKSLPVSETANGPCLSPAISGKGLGHLSYEDIYYLWVLVSQQKKCEHTTFSTFSLSHGHLWSWTHRDWATGSVCRWGSRPMMMTDPGTALHCARPKHYMSLTQWDLMTTWGWYHFICHLQIRKWRHKDCVSAQGHGSCEFLDFHLVKQRMQSCSDAHFHRSCECYVLCDGWPSRRIRTHINIKNTNIKQGNYINNKIVQLIILSNISYYRDNTYTAN